MILDIDVPESVPPLIERAELLGKVRLTLDAVQREALIIRPHPQNWIHQEIATAISRALRVTTIQKILVVHKFTLYSLQSRIKKSPPGQKNTEKSQSKGHYNIEKSPLKYKK